MLLWSSLAFSRNVVSFLESNLRRPNNFPTRYLTILELFPTFVYGCVSCSSRSRRGHWRISGSIDSEVIPGVFLAENAAMIYPDTSVPCIEICLHDLSPATRD